MLRLRAVQPHGVGGRDCQTEHLGRLARRRREEARVYTRGAGAAVRAHVRAGAADGLAWVVLGRLDYGVVVRVEVEIDAVADGGTEGVWAEYQAILADGDVMD